MRSKGTWCVSLVISGFNDRRLLHCSVPDLECGTLTKDSCEAYSPRFVRGSTPRGLFDERLFMNVFSATERAILMSCRNSLRSLLVPAAITCLLTAGNPEPVLAQAATATLTGTIEDQSGALLPNVTITVTNTDWNTSQITKTNEIGSYLLAA